MMGQSIESIANVTALPRVFSDERLNAEKIMDLLQQGKIKMLNDELSLLQETTRQTIILEVLNLVFTALIMLILIFLSIFMMFRKEKHRILHCRKSLSVLPDDLLLTNPYLLKFHKTNILY